MPDISAVKTPIFMDNHSTTPVDPRVLEAMLPYFTVHFGNAASRNHVFGWQAEAAVEHARDQIAALLGGDGKEIVWTSGATESNNLALKGAASFYKKQGNHIITVETEHKSVLDTCKRLQREGFEVTYLTPGKDG
ncbi:MAG TPA: aminotransferase class V-fold PLP-dependent enzyme, partial [Kofleriaceae bacterium]|nr:aminotransferase class V-fold PLP-dependent enzyme [Kofleriaceae bacterium]